MGRENMEHQQLGFKNRKTPLHVTQSMSADPFVLYLCGGSIEGEAEQGAETQSCSH